METLILTRSEVEQVLSPAALLDALRSGFAAPLHLSWWTTESSRWKWGGGAGLSAAAIHAELGEVIAGLQPGRETPEQVTVFWECRPRVSRLGRGLARLQRSPEMELGRRINLLS
jgi:ornithine cyclodeaminase/alanine dehydrogenase-like protein (mu-crystallin family)